MMGIVHVEKREEGACGIAACPSKECTADVVGVTTSEHVVPADPTPQPVERHDPFHQCRAPGDLTRRARVVVAVRESAQQAVLPRHEEVIGGEQSGAVSALAQHLGQRGHRFVERPFPTRSKLMRPETGKEAHVGGQRVGRGGDRPVERRPGGCERIEPRRGRAGVSIQAEAGRPNRIPDDQENVRCARLRCA